MIDTDTFLTTLYVMVDEFCKTSLPAETPPGPQATLSRSEVLTLAIFGQWEAFGSERGFYRYAQRRLRPAFPQLPTREQFNRQVRRHHAAFVACGLYLVPLLAAQRCPYEALDSTGVPTRDAKRRGAGWLPGVADIGWSNRLGWYEGFHLLLAVNPVGVITGFGFGPASTKDQPLADTFFALRRQPHPGLPSVGGPPWARILLIKALRDRRTTRYGVRFTGPRSSVRLSAIARPRGRSPFAAGWQGSVRSSKRSTISSFIPFAWTGSDPMSSVAFKSVWRPRSRCITSAFG